MTLFLLAYLAGVLTIATPCIVPVLPFVLAGGGQSFRRGALPLLLGLAFAFAAVASLAAVAGGWAVAVNHYARAVALALLFLFGFTLLSPTLAARLSQPLVALGARLSNRAAQRRTAGSSLLLGVATGLLWAPCAGPVLGLILTGAALRGPNAGTSLLLLAYGLGTATSLAAGLLLGRRLLGLFRRSAHWGEGLRRLLGAGVVAGAAAILLGLDSGVLTRWSSSNTNALERQLIQFMGVADAQATEPDMQHSIPPLTAPQLALLGASQWLNTPGLRPEDLRGKVVLVNFWTYSCINCLRTLPYVRAWAAKYKDQGLVVIGVHTPEFAFEKDVANVRTALGSLGVQYPVAIDNDFGIWRAFDNEAWPALYFIDARGRVRQRVLGEGGYDRSEQLIQKLLTEAGATTAALPIGVAGGEGTQAAGDPWHQRSDESYVGYDKAVDFDSPGGFEQDLPKLYRAAPLPLNHWSLAGQWTVGGEFATLNGASGSITYRFHARDLHLVMGPAPQGGPVRFRVLIDGAAPGANHGTDVDADGWGSVKDYRLYQLVRQSGPVQDHNFEIEFLGPGVRAYSFTFG
jgi:cytochrome c biogenesis protein CcdA/thiol-disulfide isomerase/thioredoxin